MVEAKQPLMLPHCHLSPELFIKDFKGKIIYTSRDVRAVAASAYPFITKIETLKPLVEPYVSSIRLWHYRIFRNSNQSMIMPRLQSAVIFGWVIPGKLTRDGLNRLTTETTTYSCSDSRMF